MLAHPQTRGLDIDDPHTTDLRRDIIRSNSFLFQIYEEWYGLLAAALPDVPGRVVELGSGAGFLSEVIPGLIRSEILPCSGVDAVLDGHLLPFASGSVRAFVMVDVLHHMPQPREFFREAQRCLVRGGSVVMIEPWVSTWSRLIYGNLHHEPFVPDAPDWTFPAAGPLSGANGALPWVIFLRDRESFAAEFPELVIEAVRPIMPLRYLVSGGVSRRQLMPGWSFGLWKMADRALLRWPDTWAMFAQIHLRKP